MAAYTLDRKKAETSRRKREMKKGSTICVFFKQTRLHNITINDKYCMLFVFKINIDIHVIPLDGSMEQMCLCDPC